MKPLRILHFEDSPEDAALVRHKIKQAGIEAEVVRVTSPTEFQQRMDEEKPGAIVVDSGIPGFSGLRAIQAARERAAGAPVIVLSGSASEKQVAACMEAGGHEYVLKGHWWQLFAALRRAQKAATQGEEWAELEKHDRGMSELVPVLQRLSSAHAMPEVEKLAVSAARRLTGADGAVFIVQEGGACSHVAENARAPMWKNQHHALDDGVCGWVIRNKEVMIVPDVADDSRIPASVSAQMNARSLAVVPIGCDEPLGAIAIYWLQPHSPEPAEIEVIEALANTAAIMMDNLRLYGELDRRVRERTLQLEDAVRELEAFSYSVSHDLRSPLQTIAGFAELVAFNIGASTDDATKDCLMQIQAGVGRMTRLIDDLLRLAQIGNVKLELMPVNLSALAREIAADLHSADPRRRVEAVVDPDLKVTADAGLMRVVMQNLLSNAWKYTARREFGRIQVGCTRDENLGSVFFVRDNGAGFDPACADKLFVPFQRLHSDADFAGTGVGLATVQRVIHRHTGQIWATGEPNQGATFYFTIPGPI